MLVLAGLGLNDEKDLTLREIEEAKTSDEIFIESYTSKWFGNLENMKKLLGKKPIPIGRKELEENSRKIIDMSKMKKVMIFVPGDPLIATTHLSLVNTCLKNGIKVKIIHNASIVSAIGECGLHYYKFGATVTIPSKEKFSSFPKSIYEIILLNLRNGFHTLCLLDIGLSVVDALERLEEAENLYGRFLPEKLIVASRLGSEEKKILYGGVDSLKNQNNIDLPSIIIIPGKLHFSEEEYLQHFSI